MSVCNQSEASTVLTTSTPTLSMSVNPLVISTRVFLQFRFALFHLLPVSNVISYTLYASASSANISVLVLYYSGGIF